MPSGRHPSLRVLAVTALVLTGCNTVGPPSVRRAPFEYNEALVQSRNEQLLLNLVRLRYRDTPYFLEPTSLSTQYELSGGANAAITVVERGDGQGSAGTGFSIVERPTVTWNPLQGEKFVKQILSPIPLETVLLLPEAGWSIERVLRLTVQTLNDLPNAPSASGPTPSYAPVFAEFQEVACALRRLQVAGRLRVVVGPPGGGVAGPEGAGEDEGEVQYRLLLRKPWRDPVPPEVCAVPLPAAASAAAARALPAPESWPAAGLVLRNAYLDDRDLGTREIALETRSLLESMYYLSQGVDAPAEHGPGGRGLVTHATGCDPDGAVPPEVAPWRELTRNLFRVRCSRSRPDDAFARVRYQGTWFYVPDSDLDSKSTFGLLMQLYSLQSGDAKGLTPQLTLDLGG